jgi:hypothetical protein
MEEGVVVPDFPDFPDFPRISAGFPRQGELAGRYPCPPAQVALQKRARLLRENVTDDRTIQAGVVDGVFEGAVLSGSVIFFDHVDQRHPRGRVIGNRESHGIRGVAARKAIATATSVTEIAPFIAVAFGEIRRGRVAGSAKQIA